MFFRAPGKLESTNISFQAASEIQLSVAPHYNKSYLQPAEAMVKSYNSIVRIHSNYDPKTPDSLLSQIWNIADSIYRSETELEPGLLQTAKKRNLDHNMEA